MPFFQNAQNTDARGATFHDVRGDLFIGAGQLHITYTNSADPLVDALRPVPEAIYDSIRSFSGCMEGTRQDIIGAITAWMDGENDKSICWLYGAAGSGKSAISRTIAERCANSGRLGGSFFFMRGAGRQSSITHFISTLAHNLAFSVPSTRPFIEHVLRRDRYILHRSLEHQFQELIADPVRSVTMPALPMVFIVDALDECNDKDMIAGFVEIIAHATGHHRLPLRFFFTSRVEEHIRKPFSVSSTPPITHCFSLENFNADHDILTFFRSRFSQIYQENRRLMRIPLPWPSESDLYELVEKSSGSFIFAVTLVNFVNDGSDLPHRKLQGALKNHGGLDPLYTQVLQAGSRSPHFRRILETIMIIEDYLSIADLACLLGIEAGEVIHALLGVQSILIIPENDEQPVRPLHTSLRDFLLTQPRSKDLFIDPATRHLLITSDCLKSMTDHSGGEFFKYGGLKFASRSWCRHLLGAIEMEGGDKLLFSQHFAFMMNILTNFVSWSFDSWVDSLIIQRKFFNTLKTLGSIISTLERFAGCPQDMLLMIGKIKALMENEKHYKFWNDNHLDRLDLDLLDDYDYYYLIDRQTSSGHSSNLSKLASTTIQPQSNTTSNMPTRPTGWISDLPKPNNLPLSSDQLPNSVINDSRAGIQTTHGWFTAENALQHIKNNISNLADAFSEWHIGESQYAVCAGFDESLVQMGVGYLEQIHVFTSTAVDTSSPLLSVLGNIFSPFPAILFTKSSSHQIPVFKDDGSAWDFDELVFSRASKFVDAGSTVAMLSTGTSLAQGAPEGNASGLVSKGSTEDGEDEENGNEEQGDDERRDERDAEDDTNENDGDPPGSDPDDPMGDNEADTRLPRVSFDVLAQIYGGGDRLHPKVFQMLQMEGALVAKTKPSCEAHDQFGKCEVEFTKLKFGSKRTTKSTSYEQYHVRVTVDSKDENADVDVRKPLRSIALDREITETSAGKVAWGGTIGGALGGIFGVTTATVTGTATRTSEASSSLEQRRFSSRITKQSMLGVAWWGFNIDDPYEREGGIEMSDATLPSVEFEFLGESDAPPSPPEHVDIEVASYWSIMTSSGHDLNWLNRLLASKTGSYSNLCQVVAMRVPSNLSKRSAYKATIHVNSGSQLKIRRPGSIEVTPSVWFGDDCTPVQSRDLRRESRLELPTLKLTR